MHIKTKRPRINNLNLYFRKLEKGKQMNSKARIKKIKRRVDINEYETGNQNRKSTKPKLFFEQIN